MVALLKQPRIGLAGGRRIGIDEMAKDEKSRKELEELLVLMEAIESEDSAADRGPPTAREQKRTGT